jgi:hypothetical protein
MRRTGPRVQRVEVPEDAPALGAYDYASAFEVALPTRVPGHRNSGPGPLSSRPQSPFAGPCCSDGDTS